MDHRISYAKFKFDIKCTIDDINILYMMSKI